MIDKTALYNEIDYRIYVLQNSQFSSEHAREVALGRLAELQSLRSWLDNQHDAIAHKATFE